MRATHGGAVSNWIKVNKGLHHKSEVLQVAEKLAVTEDEVVGICLRFWAWADDETDDGQLPGCTREMVDRIVQRPGFADAMIDVAWLLEDARGLIIPNFHRHQGDSAKKRALKAERQAGWRKRKGR